MMTRPHRPARRLPASVALGLLTAFLPTDPLPAESPALGTDVRRDPTVRAVEKVMPSVVNLATEEIVPIRDPLENLFRDYFDPYYRQRRPNTQFSLGSGVILDEEGYIITNYHVVGRARRVWVTLHDGREVEAEKIAVNPATDLALIRLKAKPGERFTAVPLAEDDDLLLGETVLALGNPFGLGGSVSRGILSSKARRPPTSAEPMDVPDWLQTDAAINPGNSGGPLVNLKGELIGINVAVLNQAQGIGFAIPVRRVAEKIADIYTPETLDSLWFGARVRPGRTPLRILRVEPDSPAARAGLLAGDLIESVNGRAPRSFIEFTGTLRSAGDRQDVQLALRRGDARRAAAVRQVPEASFFNAALIRKRTGASVEPLTPAEAASLGLARPDGLRITTVERLSPAAHARLQRGMILTGLDGGPAPDTLTLARRLHAEPAGGRVSLRLIVPLQRGNFIRLSETTAEIVVR